MDTYAGLVLHHCRYATLEIEDKAKVHQREYCYWVPHCPRKRVLPDREICMWRSADFIEKTNN